MLVSSSSVAGFTHDWQVGHSPSALITRAEPGSLSLRPIRLLHGASAAFPGRCPLRYLLNEQFTGQTPLSLLDQPGLSWRFQSSIYMPYF